MKVLRKDQFMKLIKNRSSLSLLSLSIMIAGLGVAAQATLKGSNLPPLANPTSTQSNSKTISQISTQKQEQDNSGANSEDTQEAPYFIDGLHCEGIPAKESWLFSGADEKARFEKKMSQGYCDSLFGMYGIKKFELYTPEQIEYLQHALRKVENVEVKDLSLKKSSQPGHVHIYLKLQMDQENRYSVDYTYEMHADKEGSPGQAHGINLDVTIPEASRPFFWNFNFDHYDYKADKPLTESLLWSPEQKDWNQSPHAMVNKLGLSFGNSIPMSPISFAYNATVLTHNMNQHRRLGVDSGTTLNLLFNSAGERSMSSFGLLLDFASASPFVETPDNKSTEKNRIGLVLNSELGEKERQFFKAKVMLLAPSGAEDSGLLISNINFGWTTDLYFEQFFLNMDAVSGFRKDKNFDLGLQRRFAAHGRNFDAEFGFNKMFLVKEGRLHLSPFIGTTSTYYSVLNPGESSKQDSAGSGKAGLKLTWETAHFDVSGTLTYFGSRTH